VKRFFGIFVLTPAEQRLVIFVVVALVAGAWIGHHREMRLNEAPRSAPELSPLVSPTPMER